MITLNALQLPEGLLWSDEIEDSRVRMSITHSLGGGKQFIQKSILSAGREITLNGGDKHGHMRRDMLLQIKSLSATGGTYTLVMHNSNSYQIKFRYPSPVSAELMKLKQAPDDADLYNNVLIKMVTV